MSRYLAAIAMAAVLSACRTQSPVASLRIDPTLASLVPADTLFLMGADVEAIRNTSVYQKHIGIVELPRLNEFTRQTGLDPRKDLSEVLSVSNGKTGLFMARGRFNTGDLEGRLEKQGVRRFDYNGHSFFGDDRNAITFVNASIALAGSTATLKSAIDQPHRGLPPALADRLRSIHEGSQIWVAFVGGIRGLDVNAPENSNLAAVIGLLRGIDSAALGMDLRNGFDLSGDASCKTEDHAKQLRLALKGIIGLGRLSTPDTNPDLLRVYDAIQVDQVQTKVTVKAHVPPELADKFIDLWLKRR